jgi:ADP-ribosylglycohydrolase
MACSQTQRELWMQVDLWMELGFLLRAEMTQRRQEGYDVAALEAKLDGLGDRPALADIEALLGELQTLKPQADFPYDEPSDLEAIRGLRPDGPRRFQVTFAEPKLYDRILGAWLGRCAGCLLGKPVEGWTRQHIEDYLRLADAYPLTNYIPYLIPHPAGYVLHPSALEATLGHIDGMARDDDLDYTVMGLHLLEEHGLAFTTGHVAAEWLTHLPYELVYTAERITYRNLANGLAPPRTALYRNPYREWIGAQIRADAWGYVSPGWPERAAELAFRDAALSHAKNGIYGEMWVAAMLAAAFVVDDIREVIGIGLSEIPANCRLAEAMREVMNWSKECPTWQEAWERVAEAYGGYHPIHTINNACLVVLGLLYGEGDFERAISIAVMGGWDTDCNGATVGSIVGALLGAGALPQKWIAPVGDRLKSIVTGFTECAISDLARRTLAQASDNLNLR